MTNFFVYWANSVLRAHISTTNCDSTIAQWGVLLIQVALFSKILFKTVILHNIKSVKCVDHFVEQFLNYMKLLIFRGVLPSVHCHLRKFPVFWDPRVINVLLKIRIMIWNFLSDSQKLNIWWKERENSKYRPLFRFRLYHFRKSYLMLLVYPKCPDTDLNFPFFMDFYSLFRLVSK